MKFLFDFFPILLFFIVYRTHDIYAATLVAIIASGLQVGWQWLRHRRVDRMLFATFLLILVLGGLTIALQDRAFIMWKPTIINWLIAVVFLASHFIGRKPLVQRMMEHAIQATDAVWRRLNLLWTGFFLFLGVLNLLVANRFFRAEQTLFSLAGTSDVDLTRCNELFTDQLFVLCQQAHTFENDWVNFKLFGLMGLTFAFVIAQAFYLARHVRDEAPAGDSKAG